MTFTLPAFAATVRTWALCAVSLAAAPSFAIDRPADDRFQSWVQAEARQRPQNFTGQFESSDTNRRLARAILDSLWDDKNYREHLHAWLDEHQAPTAEDLVQAWIVDYHQAFAGSLEFADKSMSLMWRLQGMNSTGALDRAQCAKASPESLGGQFEAAHARLLAEHADDVARLMPAIMGREYARRDHPHPGDQQVPEIMVMISRATLRAVADSLPPDDGKRLVGRYSYVPPDQRHADSPQERCEQDWVVSHAIDDGRLNDTSRHVSSLLLQQQLTKSAYRGMFDRWDAQGRTQPGRPGFKPGKAAIETPALLSQHQAAGSTRVKIEVDNTGRYQRATLLSSTVQPEQVQSIDGGTFKSADLLLGVVDAYYRAGTFEPRMVDGTPQADAFFVQFEWR